MFLKIELTFEPAKLLEKDVSGNYKYATICSVGDSIKADGNAIVLNNKYIINDTLKVFTKYGKLLIIKEIQELKLG